MVLASNEWLNNCEDDQKSAASNNTAITNHDIATATTTTQQQQQQTVNTATTSTAADANSTNITIIRTSIPTFAAVTSNVNNSLSNFQSMAESTANEQLQQQQQQPTANERELVDHTKVATAGISVAAPETVNNNRELVNTNFHGCDTPLENLNSNTNKNVIAIANANANANANNISNSNINSIANANANSISYSNPNSNTNTLQSAIVRQQQQQQQQHKTTPVCQSATMPLSSPITPQALSSALQSVMNATNNANVTNASTAVGNLQNSFLSTLGMDIGANTVALQQTAKQLSSNFCGGLVDPQVNLANNPNSIIPAGSCMSINLDVEKEPNSVAKIMLLCEANSHPFQTRTIFLTPNIECKVGRLIAKSKASESNAIFDCKVLSRNHAVLWYTDDGKFWVKDTKSSNGTFINENKLGNEAAELHFGDIVKFGVDVLENSRKEVHGCIIAFVKLYLPDGREAISIDSVAQRSQYSGEGRISYEEMHRLNLYMQEVSQREKALKSKLFNIQNVLDATRKNSALCWQSLIAEDQLLHRINSLEKKLQIMEKNVPENVLRNEILKLLEDKNSYQLTAKEALRKVYQERCDAMQMLSKMESAYASSDSECKILRDQIMNTKQTLQDVNARLERLESDYNDYKQEVEGKQLQMSEEEEMRIAELGEKLRQREIECDVLRRRVSEFMLQHAELLEDEEEKKLQKQAIDKLDAVIGDMDLGDDDEDDDDAEDEGDGEDKEVGKESSKKASRHRKVKTNKKDADALNGSVKEDETNVSSNREMCKCKPKDAKESTILKWLQNSDLNKKEGSLDIFKAICNESDSSDEQDALLSGGETGAGANATNKLSGGDYAIKVKKFNKNLQAIQLNLKQLEADITSETDTSSGYCDVNTKYTDEDSDEEGGDSDGDGDDKELLIKRNGKARRDVEKDSNRIYLLKSSVDMLREAYNEICSSMPLDEQQNVLKIETSPPPAISVQTQFQNYAPYNPSNSAAKKLEAQDTLKPLLEAIEDEKDYEQEYDDEQLSDMSARFSTDSRQTVKGATIKNKAATAEENSSSVENLEILSYQEEISILNLKLERVESDAQNTLEIMQIECDSFKEKVAELTKLIQTMSEEKQILENIIEEQKSKPLIAQSADKSKNEVNDNKLPEVATSSDTVLQANKDVKDASNMKYNDTVKTVWEANKECGMLSFDEVTCEDLKAINSSVVQREEELIVYKERLEQTQIDNLQLRNQIADLKDRKGSYGQALMMRQMLVYGAAVAAVIAYFVTTYF